MKDLSKLSIRAHPDDNVVVVTDFLEKGNYKYKDKENFNVSEDVPLGHKIALYKILLGEDVIRYGHPIGEATDNISVGDLVHVHNIRSKRSHV